VAIASAMAPDRHGDELRNTSNLKRKTWLLKSNSRLCYGESHRIGRIAKDAILPAIAAALLEIVA
jgi:hypothetical protein